MEGNMVALLLGLCVLAAITGYVIGRANVANLRRILKATEETRDSYFNELTARHLRMERLQAEFASACLDRDEYAETARVNAAKAREAAEDASKARAELAEHAELADIGRRRREAEQRRNQKLKDKRAAKKATAETPAKPACTPAPAPALSGRQRRRQGKQRKS